MLVLLSMGIAQAKDHTRLGIATGDGPALRPAFGLAAFSPHFSPHKDDVLAKVSAVSPALDLNIECMAKVVYHEARDQPFRSQQAIAEVVQNRSRSPRFPHTYCAVANQPGQFFRTDAFHVPINSMKWHTAVSVANKVHARTLQAMTFGALFYHAASMEPHWPARRQRVAEVEGNIFYR